jgi:hypothetical protein
VAENGCAAVMPVVANVQIAALLLPMMTGAEHPV